MSGGPTGGIGGTGGTGGTAGTTDDLLAYPRQLPGPLRELAGRVRAWAAAADSLASAVDRDRGDLRHAWEGDQADSCDAEGAAVTGLLHRLARTAREVLAGLTEAADVLDGGRSAVDALRRELGDVLVRHAAAVAAAPWGAAPAAGPGDLAVTVTGLRARHAAVLAAVDDDLHAAAARVVRGLEAVRPAGAPEAVLVASLPLLAAARGAAAPTSPEATRPWWTLLTSDERRALLVALPGRLGALDGLPARARGRANETRLHRDLARWRQRSGRPSWAWVGDRPPWLLAGALVVARTLAYARSRRDPVTGRRLPASLLVYEPAAFGGQGRVAVAIGDLDRAEHVAVLVPGLGTTVPGSLPGLTADAVRVAQQARRVAPGERTAVVAWAAYDAPNLRAVATESAARDGARLLAADLGALQAARRSPAHLTVVGHSYGSTTAGVALRDLRPRVDDVVLLGSPGAGVERATDLHVRPGHVWVGAASRDPVSYLDRFGVDPAHERFGAVRFPAEDVDRHPALLDLHDHSRYYAAGSESLDAVSRVVVGEGDSVPRAPFREELPWAPDGIALDPEADRAPGTVPVQRTGPVPVGGAGSSSW